jgi:hypothetical protein
MRPKFLCQNMLGIYSINRLLDSMLKISVINNGFHFMLQVQQLERLELDKLRLQKVELESLIRQFQDNNESSKN